MFLYNLHSKNLPWSLVPMGPAAPQHSAAQQQQQRCSSRAWAAHLLLHCWALTSSLTSFLLFLESLLGWVIAAHRQAEAILRHFHSTSQTELLSRMKWESSGNSLTEKSCGMLERTQPCSPAKFWHVKKHKSHSTCCGNRLQDIVTSGASVLTSLSGPKKLSPHIADPGTQVFGVSSHHPQARVQEQNPPSLHQKHWTKADNELFDWQLSTAEGC